MRPPRGLAGQCLLVLATEDRPVTNTDIRTRMEREGNSHTYFQIRSALAYLADPGRVGGGQVPFAEITGRRPDGRHTPLWQITDYGREALAENEMTPCEVCGLPTPSKYGVCKRRRECQNEYDRRRSAAKVQPPQGPPCDVCGHPTRNKYGVCFSRSPECKREYRRRERLANLDARREYEREWFRANRKRKNAAGAAWRAANPERARANRRASGKVWEAAHPEVVRAYRLRYLASEQYRSTRRAYLQRTDRPCVYARLGCTQFAVTGQALCREYKRVASRRREQRKQQRTSRRLASAQGGICTWCNTALPDDLSGTHIDHIIPKVCGGPDLEWNLALLHKGCNLSKSDRITPQAIKLAAAHGVTIIPSARRSVNFPAA